MTYSNKAKQKVLMDRIKDHMEKNKIPMTGTKGICKALGLNHKTVYNWLQGETQGNTVLVQDFYKRYKEKFNKGKEL